jgi:hypothetical protein
MIIDIFPLFLVLWLYVGCCAMLCSYGILSKYLFWMGEACFHARSCCMPRSNYSLVVKKDSFHLVSSMDVFLDLLWSR